MNGGARHSATVYTRRAEWLRREEPLRKALSDQSQWLDPVTGLNRARRSPFAQVPLRRCRCFYRYCQRSKCHGSSLSRCYSLTKLQFTCLFVCYPNGSGGVAANLSLYSPADWQTKLYLALSPCRRPPSVVFSFVFPRRAPDPTAAADCDCHFVKRQTSGREW